MATLPHLRHLHSPFPLSWEFRHRGIPKAPPSFVNPLLLSSRIRVFTSSSLKARYRKCSFCCFCKVNSQLEKVQVEEEEVERPPFDINLAVILAGFAFEAYTTPPEDTGRREVDAAGCMTVYLSESFVREIYDGQLFIKLKKGYDLPAMDPWGTSDPYVIMEFDGQVVKSKIKWGTKEPTWNEEFTMNIRLPPGTLLQVAAWDANLFTPHKRMGNAGVNLEGLCDGNLHELLVELEGMGGGGKIQLEMKYRSFEEIDDDKKWWRIPFVSEFLNKKSFDSAIKMLAASEGVPARQFVQYAFSQLKSLNETYLQNDWLQNIVKHENKNDEGSSESSCELETPALPDNYVEGSSNDPTIKDGGNAQKFSSSDTGESTQSSKHFWKNFADCINQNVVWRLGIPVPDKMKWDGFDTIKKIGIQSQQAAEAGYIEFGLATPKSEDPNSDKNAEAKPINISKIQPSLLDIKKATEDILRQTDSIFSALMVLAAAVPQLKNDSQNEKDDENKEDSSRKGDDHALDYLKSEKDDENKEDSSRKEDDHALDYLKSDGIASLDEKRAEEMRALFSTAESAMEAWAMLATSLGQPSLIKSEFEKIFFLDNPSTDTEVAVWRDSTRKRLVVAFRGTEQAKWKDLLTDLMLVPAGLNPERIGGDFKEEVQVHSGFLSAYDSVRPRLMSLIKKAIGFIGDASEPQFQWHVYCTGHSLGGALATLLALELSSSQLAKTGAISVTMYNFGSPRVGNKRFAEVYNKKVKDSWRVVNHRDIIPTVPRLMGYCHVAQPVYLKAGDHKSVEENVEYLDDGYQGDVIGEATPDVLVSEFMKGEKELIDRILQTEINIFRALRDGSALMQHMEDFYYISLLENVRRNYRAASLPVTREEGSSIG